MPDYAAQRSNMVASQILANDVTDTRLLAAFAKIERERFVPGAKRALAYADAQVEIVPGRWLLDPRTFAKLLRLAEIFPEDKVLDVGCTAGYSTAVLSLIAGRVVGLEQDADLVRVASEAVRTLPAPNATVVQNSLPDGYGTAAPYDVIVIEGAIEAAPHALLAQLADGGRLVTIVRNEVQGHAVLYLNEQGRIGRRVAFDASAHVLAGFRQPAGFVF
jgi:protein-L-isoaspartate(D-aspartate) O-methyltransferase